MQEKDSKKENKPGPKLLKFAALFLITESLMALVGGILIYLRVMPIHQEIANAMENGVVLGIPWMTFTFMYISAKLIAGYLLLKINRQALYLLIIIFIITIAGEIYARSPQFGIMEILDLFPLLVALKYHKQLA